MEIISYLYHELNHLSIPAEEFQVGLAESTIHGRLSPAWVHLITWVNKWRGRLGLKPTIDCKPTTYHSAR